MKRRYKTNIGTQAIALAASSGVSQLIVASLYIISARSVEPTSFGLVVTAIAIGTTAVGFLDFGTNSLWVREVASGRMDVTTLGNRMSFKLLYAFVIFSAWSAFTAAFFWSSDLWAAGPVAMSVLLAQSFHVPLRGNGRGELVAIAILGDRLVAASSFGMFLAIGFEPLSALWISLSIGGVASALIAWRFTPRQNRSVLRMCNFINPWTGSRHFGVANVALSAQSLDIPALTLFGGPGAAGIYAAVSRWTQPMGLLASAFASAAAPHVARAASFKAAWVEARKSMWLLGGAIMTCLMVALYAPHVVEILLGSEYKGSADVLRVLALAAMFAVGNQPLFVFLQSRGFDRAASLITVGCIFVQLSLVLVLAPFLHAIGAALASLCSQLLMLIALVVVLLKKRNQTRDNASVPAEKLEDAQ